MPFSTILRLMILQGIGVLAVAGLLLFLPAGTLAWPAAWVFLALFFSLSQATGLWLLQRDPELLAARMRSPLSRAQAPRDRTIIIAILICFAAWFVFMAMDARRFAWSHTALWLKVAGGSLIALAFWGWAEVLRVNSFAATTIEIQEVREQSVVDSGPYALVRHPMYAFALLLMIGTPLLLGSVWGLAWLLLFVPLLATRAVGEEAMLRRGLAGYEGYTQKVRFRFVPGVW